MVPEILFFFKFCFSKTRAEKAAFLLLSQMTNPAVYINNLRKNNKKQII